MSAVSISDLYVGTTYRYHATTVMGVTEGHAVFTGFSDGLPMFLGQNFPVPVIMNPINGWSFYTKTDSEN